MGRVDRADANAAKHGLRTLDAAIDEAAYAKTCIRQNRGLAKVEARLAYEACIDDVLTPAMMEVLDGAELSCEDVVAIAKFMRKRRDKRKR